MDNLDRALTTVPESALKAAVDSAAAEESNKDLVNLFDGLKMTEKMLMQALAKHGLERYDPAGKGDKFDPNLHDASFMAPMKDKEDGTVFTTIQKGFLLNGRVVRVSLPTQHVTTASDESVVVLGFTDQVYSTSPPSY